MQLSVYFFEIPWKQQPKGILNLGATRSRCFVLSWSSSGHRDSHNYKGKLKGNPFSGFPCLEKHPTSVQLGALSDQIRVKLVRVYLERNRVHHERLAIG